MSVCVPKSQQFDGAGISVYSHQIRLLKPFPPHSHEFTELAVIVEGSARHTIARETFEVMMGDTYIINEGVTHRFSNVQELILANIMFDVHALDLPLNVMRTEPGFRALFDLEPAARKAHEFRSRLRLLPPQMDLLLRLRRELEREIRDRKQGYQTVARNLLICILSYLGRCYSEMPDERSRALSRIGSILVYLDNNYREPLSINSLARAFFLSESTLVRRFKEATRLSPINYLIHLRIKKACDLLLRTDMSVTEIAYEVGFSSSDYFSRQFRRLILTTPREFRKEKQAQHGSILSRAPGSRLERSLPVFHFQESRFYPG